MIADPGVADSTSSEKPGRSFGPDAAPRRKQNKARGGSKTERGPKGPMREVTRGQFFGDDDDEYSDDDLDGENFASRDSESEYDEN